MSIHRDYYHSQRIVIQVIAQRIEQVSALIEVVRLVLEDRLRQQ